ncbi:hypothetical protein UY3_06078 [Chelonia mydas]|uniref:Uncharacterized protein n=1 Tax=Chelonia mydas TaxID=8469 RepID=M7BX80_CHEMY|nr:hypothetical protein UY3_06078 [Chelonia mydas]
MIFQAGLNLHELKLKEENDLESPAPIRCSKRKIAMSVQTPVIDLTEVFQEHPGDKRWLSVLLHLLLRRQGAAAVQQCSTASASSTQETYSDSELSGLHACRDMTLEANSASSLSPAEQLCRIRKRPRRTKEDFLREVMTHSAAEKQELKEWRDSEKRDRKENAAPQNEAQSGS